MADNVDYTPGAGATIAADDIGGVLHQRAKLVWGVDGVAVDASASNPLPVTISGVSTETTLAALNTKTPAQGQALMAASLPVVIASNQSAVPVSMSAVPTGASTETTLAALSAKFSSLGQTTMSASAPVVLASNQSAIPVTATDLATLVARQPALGATTGANASPVTVSTETATGNITTQNLVANGAATANSAVEITLNGGTTLSIQTTGTYTGALSVQLTNDNSRWETVTVAQIVNAITGVGTATITSAAIGIFTFDCRGFLKARVTGLAAMTGTAVVTLRSTQSPSAVTVVQPTAANLNATVSGTVTATVASTTVTSISAGTNAIGDAGIQYRASATGAGTVTALTCPATPAAQNVKSGAGRLIGLYLVNTNATIRYCKVYNVVAPTLASATAAMRIALPQNQPVYINFEGGMAFSTGITFAMTSTASITDSTGAVTLDDVTGFSVHA